MNGLRVGSLLVATLLTGLVAWALVLAGKSSVQP
jgi:hypothetical protein